MKPMPLLMAIALSFGGTSLQAQSTGPTVPDKPPAPIEGEHHRPDTKPSDRPASPGAEKDPARKDDPNRPRSEQLPPEIDPSPGRHSSKASDAGLVEQAPRA